MDAWLETGLSPAVVSAVTKRLQRRKRPRGQRGSAGDAAADAERPPTAVQRAALPALLKGNDALVVSPTGSGKTMCYLLPIVHALLARAQEEADGAGGGGAGAGGASTRYALLMPTRELCGQVFRELSALLAACGLTSRVSLVDASASSSSAANVRVARSAAAIVATPSRAAALLLPGGVAGLEMLVMDECDLMLGFGHERDVVKIADALPKRCQRVLVGATAGPAAREGAGEEGEGEDGGPAGAAAAPSVEDMFLRKGHEVVSVGPAGGPHEGGAGAGGGLPATISHRSVRVGGRRDAELAVVTMLRLKLVQRRVLVFVPGGVDGAVRLRLFLEAFGVASAVLNEALPRESRAHTLEQFNRGVFDVLIASEDAHESPEEGAAAKRRRRGRPQEQEEEEEDEDDGGEGPGGAAAGEGPDGRDRLLFGVTRGVDFRGVSTVVNMDVPGSFGEYVHRCGRTGRAGDAGTAVTVVTPEREAALEAIRGELVAQLGPGGGPVLSDLESVSASAMDAFRYRAEDVSRSITKAVVRSARAMEIRQEILNSERLREYFGDNPNNLQLLRHDAPLLRSGGVGGAGGGGGQHVAATAPHLRHIPEYLATRAGVSAAVANAGSSGRRKSRTKHGRGAALAMKRGTDPLKKIKFRRGKDA